MAGPSLESLKITFADEDTATWTRAARAIGRRAVDDPEALAFIRHWLARSPSVAGDEDGNIHRFRHACCALAAFVSQPSADRSLLEAEWRTQALGPLVNLAFHGLTAANGLIRDLSQIHDLAERFEQWRAGQREILRGRIDKLAAADNQKGVEANTSKLEALEALSPDDRIPSTFKPDLPGLLPHSPWALASYFAGVEALVALGGVPVDALVRGLVELARTRRDNGLPFVLNLPILLTSIRAELEAEVWDRAAAIVREAHDPGWVAGRLHYNELALSVGTLPSAEPFVDRWVRGLELPEGLRRGIDALAREAATPTPQLGRSAARVMRQIAESSFVDDWRWDEMNAGERFCLNTFALLAVHGPGPLADRPEDPKRDLSVAHRIVLVLEALQRGFRAREQVVPTLVRCLKLLLDRELREHANRDDLAEVCRRQVALVRPLVAEWRLPGTLRKDLATIVCRVLVATYRKDRAAFVELLYHVLYALPDEVLFREVIEYSTEPEISALVAAIVAVVEAAHGEQSADLLMSRYLEFARQVAAIAGDRESLSWVSELPQMVRLCGRVDAGRSGEAEVQGVPAPGGPGVRAEPGGGPARSSPAVELALQSVLRCRGDMQTDFRELVSARRGDKKGAAWAAHEEARQQAQRSRRAFDRFSRLLDDIQILESDCLPEVGRPRPSDDLARRWRRLIGAHDELSSLSAEALPYLEREVTVALLEERIAHLERRLGALVDVLEKEDEAVAVSVLTRRMSASEARTDAPADLVHEDERLVQEWMLDRYMIRELAATQGLRVLRLLTSPAFVAVWILSPFVVCGVLYQLGATRWQGVPFLVSMVGNVGLLAAYFVEARSPRTAATGTGRYLLPQITAALFLGIMEVLAADEAWSLAVLQDGGVRLFMLAVFLGTGFFFIREVLLGEQLKGRAEIRKKSRRAASVMSLILWQSFALVTLFGVLGGRVMGERAGLDGAALASLQDAAAAFLPAEVTLGSGAYRIFPWALLSWTVQVFFFSAIFERIMRSNDG